MTTRDPITGQPFPADVIQRVLFVAQKVHVYNIPPLTSTKGYMAAAWTADNNKRHIFDARVRVVETAIPTADGKETVTTNILLEDSGTGELFAAAPYTSAAVVEQVLDSSRFFAVRVQGEGGRKAMLGMGFEERSEAFDFGISLQEVRKVQGLQTGAAGAVAGKRAPSKPAPPPDSHDFSLKQGETITLNIGGKSSRSTNQTSQQVPSSTMSDAPLPFLPPPPSAQAIKAQRRSQQFVAPPPASAADLGFDDGEFGEFQ
ncbi:MAG: hypothetical protein M1838_003240 [Thelocarpon superellum]|nr:MAG: hypothetical protein M1838_003240 [Thelocarpon superellum]